MQLLVKKNTPVNAWDTTVSAAADSAVTVTPTIDDTNRTRAYEVTVNTDGNTIKVENGQLTANTTPLATTDGKVDAPAMQMHWQLQVTSLMRLTTLVGKQHQVQQVQVLLMARQKS
ncbi:Uncharacterised protein [Moraxella osloensis]|uniref:Uncharacterized protein n=2 Tax=Faucicola osloensis TaxID=34062 RepID=A0A378QUZ4_FAUOS|nr:Uncharacterised protein [Moraxella osloensis]